MGTLTAIYTAPQAAAPMQPRTAVRAVPRRGLEGDRYFDGTGAFSRWPGPRRELSLIAAEDLDALLAATGLDLTHGEHRRNLVTHGVNLRALRRETFVIGNVQVRGVSFCSPCGYLDRLTQPGVRAALLGKGGLRAEILSEGTLRVGDTIRVLSAG